MNEPVRDLCAKLARDAASVKPALRLLPGGERRDVILSMASGLRERSARERADLSGALVAPDDYGTALDPPDAAVRRVFDWVPRSTHAGFQDSRGQHRRV